MRVLRDGGLLRALAATAVWAGVWAGVVFLGEGGIVASFLSGPSDSPVMPGMTPLVKERGRNSKRISWHLQRATVR